MAFQLKVSNSLANLAGAFCLDLKGLSRPVFHTDYVVTQTEGMNSWLKTQMAGHLGIAANYEFLKPNDLIHLVYRILGGQYQQPLSSENQCWLLYSILGETSFVQAFPEVASYFLKAGEDRDLKRMALAEKVADLFDQYQIYRPDMVRRWNQNALADCLGKPGEWQQYLWIRCKDLLGNQLPDKSSVGNFILQALKDPAKRARLQAQLPAVYLFGLSVTTAFHLQIFHELGRHCSVSFYLLNPAPSVYWFEDRSEKQLAFLKRKGWALPDDEFYGNPLLTSWGKLIQNTFSLLFESEEVLNTYEDLPVDEPLGDSLLRKVQLDIYHNRSTEERSSFSMDDLLDGSFSVQSCYTPAREVEALYNYLVQLVDQRKLSLSARDIVVMVSDVDAYAPYIRAVFDNAPFRFPYTIADESYAAEDSIASALKTILSLNEHSFGAERVMQLLDSQFIRRRFGLSDLSFIRKVVQRAGIRFGMAGKREDESMYLSWKYGLKRILYGICMSGEEEYAGEGEVLYPLDMVEGQAAHEIIRFCHFIDVLMASVEERKANRSLSDWGAYVERVLHHLIVDAAEESEEDYMLLLKQLEKYNSLNGMMQEELSYEVFSRTFLQTLGSATRTGSFAAGGITFCSLIPMRSIPFRVVCLLGLNFDKFPRREQPTAFSLMEREKRKGDRNVKENDKHLFLETLLSARDYLYLSYMGQNVKDNTSMPPSALIDELLDYIQAAYSGKEDVKDILVVKHPLHGFSKKYQMELPGLVDYLHRQENADSPSRILLPETREMPALEELQIEALISFCKHPVKAYFNQVLGIRYESEEVLLRETELFEADELLNWSLKQELLSRGEDEREALRSRLVKTAAMPLKNMSHVAMLDVADEVAPVKELFDACVGAAEEREEHVVLELPLENIQISGRLTSIYGDKLVAVCWSKSETKYLLEGYVRLLVARAAGLPLSLYFISSSKKKVFKAGSVGQSEALVALSGILHLYQEGQRQILPFWPGFKITPDKLKGMTQETFVDAIRKVMENRQYPCKDPYILRKHQDGYFNGPQSFELYQRCASLLLKPLLTLFPEYYEV